MPQPSRRSERDGCAGHQQTPIQPSVRPDKPLTSDNNSSSGAILALDASLTHLGGGINGSVAVREIASLNAEIRNNNYTGFIPAPGAAALLALAGLMTSRRRR